MSGGGNHSGMYSDVYYDPCLAFLVSCQTFGGRRRHGEVARLAAKREKARRNLLRLLDSDGKSANFQQRVKKWKAASIRAGEKLERKREEW